MHSAGRKIGYNSLIEDGLRLYRSLLLYTGQYPSPDRNRNDCFFPQSLPIQKREDTLYKTWDKRFWRHRWNFPDELPYNNRK